LLIFKNADGDTQHGATPGRFFTATPLPPLIGRRSSTCFLR
jgi:hypothetical protein